MRGASGNQKGAQAAARRVCRRGSRRSAREHASSQGRGGGCLAHVALESGRDGGDQKEEQTLRRA